MSDVPVPPELDVNPELAVLAILEVAIEATVSSVISSQPSLRGDELRAGDDKPDSHWMAEVMLGLAEQLLEAVRGYRSVVGEKEARARFSS